MNQQDIIKQTNYNSDSDETEYFSCISSTPTAYMNTFLDDCYEFQDTKVIEILTKSIQSGKTNDAIIAPMLLSIANKRLPILLHPSNLSLTDQSTERIQEGIVKYIDNLKMNEDDKQTLKDLGKIKVNVARFDSGVKENLDIKSLVQKIKSGDVNVMVFLNNKHGLRQLCEFLNYVYLSTFTNVDIIVDECHASLSIDLRDDLLFKQQFNESKSVFAEFTRLKKEFSTKSLKKKEFNYAHDALEFFEELAFPSGSICNFYMAYICFLYSISNNWTMTGVTATTQPLFYNKFIQQNKKDLVFQISRLNIPICYVGLNDIIRKNYTGDIEVGIEKCIKFHLQRNSPKLIMMSHVGPKNIVHLEYAKKFVEIVKAQMDDTVFGMAIIHNQKGFTFNYISSKNVFKIKSCTKKFAEPWKMLKAYSEAIATKLKKRPFIGIFGDACMKEGITYNKYEDNSKIFIDDYIMKPKKTKLSLKDSYKMTQKIGRIFGCDASQESSERRIWTPLYDNRPSDFDVVLDGNKVENYLQKAGEVCTSHLKQAKHLVKKGKLDDDGNVIDTPVTHTSGETPQQKLERMMRTVWPTADSCIANFMRNIGEETTYTEIELDKFMKDMKFKNARKPDFMEWSTPTHQTYGKIIEFVNGKYRLCTELRDLYIECFDTKN